jgi:hypothetical protein
MRGFLVFLLCLESCLSSLLYPPHSLPFATIRYSEAICWKPFAGNSVDRLNRHARILVHSTAFVSSAGLAVAAKARAKHFGELNCRADADSAAAGVGSD